MKALTEYRHIAILGMGAEGRSALNFLLSMQVEPQHISLLDQQAITDLQGYVHHTGDHYMDQLSDYDLIIKSPGISPYHDPLTQYQDRIITTTQLFFDHYQGKTIAISGTKGKSTLTTVLYQTLKDANIDCHIAGNIGIPILDLLTPEINRPDHRLVVELSSYMLDTLDFAPQIGILVNIYPDHLDRHGDFASYQHAKMNLIQSAQVKILADQIIQSYPDLCDELSYISFGNNPESDYYFAHTQRYHDRHRIGDTRMYHLHGDYIYANMSSILAVCDQLGIAYDHLHQVLLKFHGLKHRMQYLGQIQGIHRYDDAISTTPESTLAACQYLGNQVHTIMLGGTDRGYDFDLLLEWITQSQIQTLILFPDTGADISLGIHKYHKNYHILYTDNMAQAVQFARDHTPRDKICLLSTASPSYSCWKNFEEKGDLFQEAIHNL